MTVSELIQRLEQAERPDAQVKGLLPASARDKAFIEIYPQNSAVRRNEFTGDAEVCIYFLGPVHGKLYEAVDPVKPAGPLEAPPSERRYGIWTGRSWSADHMSRVFHSPSRAVMAAQLRNTRPHMGVGDPSRVEEIGEDGLPVTAERKVDFDASL